MKQTYKKAFGTLAIALAAQLYASAAFAAPPANIAGDWTAQVNQDVVQFTIAQSGLPGKCKPIVGHLNVPSDPPLVGWYCPGSGLVHLHHRNASTNATVRTITANLADTDTGVPDKMAGTVMINNTQFGPLGERPFSATKD